MRRAAPVVTVRLTALLALALIAAACTGGTSASDLRQMATCTPSGTALRIEAQNLHFDRDCLAEAETAVYKDSTLGDTPADLHREYFTRVDGLNSVVPEARRLVTRGPYALVRHPLYLGEIVALAGVALQYLSAWALLLLGLVWAFQLQRMKYEELVLFQIFPEYGDYMARTARLVPGVY